MEEVMKSKRGEGKEGKGRERIYPTKKHKLSVYHIPSSGAKENYKHIKKKMNW